MTSRPDIAHDAGVGELVSTVEHLIVVAATVDSELVRRIGFTVSDYLALTHVMRETVIAHPPRLGDLPREGWAQS